MGFRLFISSKTTVRASGMLGNRPLVCVSCGRKGLLVELTVEDVQREHSPTISVCGECREKYRSAARLETNYPTKVAVRDFALSTIAVSSAIILFSYFLPSLRPSLPVSTSQIVFFVTAATSLTGLKMAYSYLNGAYRFTHNLSWSLHSRYAVFSISLVLSGVLAAIVSIKIV